MAEVDAARIALDAFGGDGCPTAEVRGAIEATRRGVKILLVGDEARLRKALAAEGGASVEGGASIEIRHAPDVIAMDDHPAKAVRAKPDASMPTCFRLVNEGEADAAMSAGNSGAMLACGLFQYRRIKGVDRPALVTSLPTRDHDWVALLDVGANVECKPINLVQFAVMGAVYSRFKHGKERPRVGLLSNGTEDSKGTDLTRAVHGLLSAHPLEDYDYLGYVEPEGLFRGAVDVVVTDGFSGNIALKIAEATGRLVGGWVRDAVMNGGTIGKLGAAMMKGTFAELRAMLDPDNYGAAPLLGVDGVAFICHGGASPAAIANSAELAARSVHEDLMPRLADPLSRAQPLFEDSRAVAV